jgi:hypothetical protein
MWTDNETDLDLLGFKVHADLLRCVVTDPKLLPATIGVFADWGGGKTSLMKMLQCSLEPDHWPEGSPEKARYEKTACLYFNGWLFEGYDDAKSAILGSVLVALGEHARFGPQVRDKCVSLLKSVNWMRVASLGLKHVAVPAIAAFASGGTSLVPALIGSLGSLLPWRNSQPDDTPIDQSLGPQAHDTEGAKIDWETLLKNDQSPAGPLDVRSFRVKFAKMLKDSKIESLVVLIDDLDRCSPERIIENLEAIKLFLNVDNTAFVIGADPRIVRHAIAWKYRQQGDLRSETDSEGQDSVVTDYLEKLIQYPYRLPRLSPAEIETYMALLFCRSHLTDESFARTVAACDQQRSENRYGTFGYAAVQDALNRNGTPTPPDGLLDALTFCAASAPLITEGLKGNPRQVKRFLNAFILRKQLAEVAKLTNITDAVLVKLMILEYSQEKQFRQLFGWQACQNGEPKEIVELEKILREPNGNMNDEEGAKKISPEWAGSLPRRWIAMQPPLSGVDPRDYFWVARDRLQTTLTGLSMVPPVVRRTFESLISESPAKRQAGLATAAGLAKDEQEGLFRLLEQSIRSKPREKSGYDVFRLLIEAGVSGAAKNYAQALSSVPLDAIPAAVGMDLSTLSAAKPEVAQALASTLTRLEESETRAGAAVQKSRSAKQKQAR